MTVSPSLVATWVKQGLLGVSLAMLPLHRMPAQSPVLRAEYYSLDDGLSDRLVNAILQDREGFIWVATPNGLNRFDGYNFLTFNNHPDNPNSISEINVQSLDLDKEGNLVIQYQNNKLFFDLLNPQTHALTKVRLFPEDGIAGYVRTIYVNPEGEIFLVSVQKQEKEGTYLYRYRPGGLTAFELLFRIPEVHSSLSPSIHLAQLSDGAFLINDSELGLRLLSPNGALLRSFTPDDFDCLDRPNRYPGPASFLHADRAGAIWLSLAQVPGVFRYNAELHYFEQQAKLPADRFYSDLWEDQMGNILLAQRELVGIYPEVVNLFCVRPDGDIASFNYLIRISPRIQCAFAADFFKTIFLGIDTGLGILQNNRSKIRTYLSKNLEPLRHGAVIRGITGDGKGKVYFAGETDHWYVLDLTTDFLDTLFIVDEITGRPFDLSYSLNIHFDETGFLWGIANTREGEGRFHRINPELCNARTYAYPFRFSGFTSGRSDRFWLICQPENEKGGLVSFDPKTEHFEAYVDSAGKNPLRNATPYYILEDENQLLWIGTDNGLYRIEPQAKKTKVFSIKNEPQSVGLSSNTIYVIHRDSSGRLWLGTNNGLNILDPGTGNVRVIDKRNGLASNTVCGILPDKQGNYWISTNNGLSYYEPGKKQFRNFYAEDGLSHDEFIPFSCFRDEKGRYYFGGVNGINAFNTRDMLVKDPPPPVVLTKFSHFNTRQDSTIEECTGLCFLDDVVVSPYDIYFQFNFMLPNFSSPRRNQFRAWLEGYEKEWIYLGNTPSIRYNRLPAGHYTLHLNGADPNGNWSPEWLSIPILVKPVFYRTGWFFLLLALLVTGGIYGWLKYRLEQKLKVERLRTKLSSDLHDEVSGLLSGIALQTDVLQEIVPDQKSRSRLASIGEKSRKAMSKMSDVIWSIDSRNDRVNDLLLRMYEHAEEILSPLSIDYIFHVKRLDRQVKLPVRIRQELYFIFKEAVNNIVKHSDASRVDIFLGNQGAVFEMTIHDNGKAPTNKLNGKTGQGLSNIRMRAQRLQAQLDISNSEGYTVQLKMKKFA